MGGKLAKLALGEMTQDERSARQGASKERIVPKIRGRRR